MSANASVSRQTAGSCVPPTSSYLTGYPLLFSISTKRRFAANRLKPCFELSSTWERLHSGPLNSSAKRQRLPSSRCIESAQTWTRRMSGARRFYENQSSRHIHLQLLRRCAMPPAIRLLMKVRSCVGVPVNVLGDADRLWNPPEIVNPSMSRSAHFVTKPCGS